jgi:hypothetical protein
MLRRIKFGREHAPGIDRCQVEEHKRCISCLDQQYRAYYKGNNKTVQSPVLLFEPGQISIFHTVYIQVKMDKKTAFYMVLRKFNLLIIHILALITKNLNINATFAALK